MASKSKIKLLDTFQQVMTSEGKYLEKDPSRDFLNTHKHFVLLDYSTLNFEWNNAIKNVAGKAGEYVPSDNLEIEDYNSIVDSLKSNFKNHITLNALSSYKTSTNKASFISSLKLPCLIFSNSGELLGAMVSNFNSISTYITSIINKLVKFPKAGNFKGILNSGHVYLDNNRAYRTPVGFNLDNLDDILLFIDYYSKNDLDYFINRYFLSVPITIINGKINIVEPTEAKEIRYLANKGGIVFYNLFSNIIPSKYKTIFSNSSFGQTIESISNNGIIERDSKYPLFSRKEIEQLQHDIADHFKVKGNKLVSKQARNIIHTYLEAEKKFLADIHSEHSRHVEQLEVIKTFGTTFSKVGVIIQVLQSDYVNSSILATNEGKIKPRIFKKLQDALILGTSSKALIEHLESNLIKRLTGKKLDTYNSKVTKKVEVKSANKKGLITTSKPKVSGITLSKTTVKRVPKQPLRNIQGQFTSVTKLENLIRAQLRPTVVKNMHRPNLEYQTGRFADSVKLETISRARDGALTAFLSYMRYPYATFEKDGRQGKKGYYPSRLIEGSVREIASKLVRDRMRVVIQ